VVLINLQPIKKISVLNSIEQRSVSDRSMIDNALIFCLVQIIFFQYVVLNGFLTAIISVFFETF